MDSEINAETSAESTISTSPSTTQDGSSHSPEIQRLKSFPSFGSLSKLIKEAITSNNSENQDTNTAKRKSGSPASKSPTSTLNFSKGFLKSSFSLSYTPPSEENESVNTSIPIGNGTLSHSNSFNNLSPGGSFKNFLPSTPAKTLSGNTTANVSSLSSPTSPSSATQQQNIAKLLPKWIPDAEAHHCMTCNEPFTFFRRRHHCRHCGGVFCATCSMNRISLEHLGVSDPVRVCDECAFIVDPNMESSHLKLEVERGWERIRADPDLQSSQDIVVQQWLAMINKTHTELNFLDHSASVNKLNRMLFQGIPTRLRSTLWPLLAESTDLHQKNSGVYQEIVDSIPRRSQFKEFIAADVYRTFPELPEFQTKEGITRLSNVLNAFSICNGDIGYCQGLNYIAGIILLHLEEESAFWMFMQIMKKYALDGFFKEGTPLLCKYLNRFDYWFMKSLPELRDHFEKKKISIQIFISTWLKTVFAYNFPIELVLRIWDVFLIERVDFLLWIALSILEHCQEELLKMEEYEIMSFFNRLPEHTFLSLQAQFDMQT